MFIFKLFTLCIFVVVVAFAIGELLERRDIEKYNILQVRSTNNKKYISIYHIWEDLKIEVRGMGWSKGGGG